jgi:6-pyruvoyl-tetrahydropterin synthase
MKFQLFYNTGKYFTAMYAVTIRDHFMIAHSLKNALFGPAQALHGATYVVDVTFYAENIEPHNVVIDMGLAARLLHDVLEPLRYKNLDELPVFHGKLTTTEFMARHIHDMLKAASAGNFSGRIGVTLGESHVARATYEGN